MAPPAFPDIAKSIGDLLKKDFYHDNASILEVKLNTPDGLVVTTKGTSTHDKKMPGSIEAKKVLQKGITASSTWTTRGTLIPKIELNDILAAGVTAELSSEIAPKAGLQRGSLFFKQGAFHARALGVFNPINNNVTATLDGVFAHQGLLIGGEASFDVQNAALTKYAVGCGYQTPVYTLAATVTDAFSVYTTSYYHKVNPSVEAGVKASWDTKLSSTVGIELASKYRIDPTAFAKFKINDRGNVGLSYNAKINSGFTFGIGAAFDAQKLNDSNLKIGTSFTFEG